MKYKISRTSIVYESGIKDTMQNEYETNNLESERNRLITEFNCKAVYFTFTQNMIIPPNIPLPLPIDQIIAEAFGVSIDWMKTKSRKRIGVEARQMAMWWRERNTSDSLTDIGNMYGGRDHATVLHAKKTVNNLLETNRVFREKAENAIRKIEEFKN